MTIAAGVLYDGGVLLCADTMLSKPTVSIYDSKIMGYRFDDGIAVFAFSGHGGLAENAIQQCEDVLRYARANPRTKAQLASDIRSILKREYEEHILKHTLMDSAYNYNIIVAIWSQADGIGLYRTHLNALNRTRRGYECIGVGEDLAEYLLRGLYVGPRHDVHYITTLVSFVLAEIKAFMPASVGGNMIVLRLSKEGEPNVVPERVMGIIDRHTRILNAMMRHLPISVINDGTEESFKKTLEDFTVTAVHHWRQIFEEAGGRVWFDAPPREAFNLLIELRTPRGRRVPKSPKRGSPD